MQRLKEPELHIRIERFLTRKFAEFPELAPEGHARHTNDQPAGPHQPDRLHLRLRWTAESP